MRARLRQDDSQGPVRRRAGGRGDWGDVSKGDARLKDAAVKDGSRLLSAYKTSKGDKLWIITEAQGDDGRRASTYLLLPEEY